jgi:hypothetical protein
MMASAKTNFFIIFSPDLQPFGPAIADTSNELRWMRWLGFMGSNVYPSRSGAVLSFRATNLLFDANLR